MTGLRSSVDDADIDLKAIFGAVWRKKGTILLFVLLAGAAAFAVAKAMHPLYHAEAKLIIQPRDPITTTGASSNNPTDQALLDDSGVTSQVQVLQSTGLAQEMIKTFKLADRPEFGAAGKPSLVSRILARAGLGGKASNAQSQQVVLTTFQDKLNVYKVASSRVIVVQFSSQDPKLAADLPNALVKDYLLRQSGLKLSDDSETAAWLKPEIARLRTTVDAAESKVADYRAKSDLLSVGNNDTLASRELGDTASELSKVRSQRVDAEARAASVSDALKNGRSVGTLANIVDSPLIQQLRQQEVSAQAQLADLSTTLGSRHPHIRALKSQVRELNNRIRAESRKVLESIESEAGIAKLREKDLTAQLEMLKQNAGHAGEQSVKLRALEREAAADRDLLNKYLARYRQANSRSTLGAVPADARIVSNAVVPNKPYFPKTVPIVIVAMLATSLLSAIVIILSELFSGRALRPVEATEGWGQLKERDPQPNLKPLAEGMTAMAAARLLSRRSERMHEAAKESDDPLALPASDTQVETAADDLADAGRSADVSGRDRDFSIAAAATHLIDRKDAVVLCASPEGDEASAATVILARLLAEQGAHVVLVDMTDTGYPTRLMARYKALPGVTDLLTGDINFSDSLHGDRISSAHILPRGTADPDQAMRAADRLPIILDGLGDVYDFVLVECGVCDRQDIARLSREGAHRDILVTALQPSNPDVVTLLTELYASGDDDVIVMVPGVSDATGERDDDTGHTTAKA